MTVIRPSLTKLAVVIAAFVFARPTISASAQVQEPAYSSAQLDSIGRTMVAHEVQRYGRVDDSVLNQVVLQVVRPLVRATYHPGLRVQFVITKNDDYNAAAVPGGYVIVNAGIIRWFVELATAEAPSDRNRQFEREVEYLAATLAHEIAHLTLGHPGHTQWSPHYTQTLELEADRAGALYLLRAGWQIQTMMDLFRAFDRLEREKGVAYTQQYVSYLRDHPRGSVREAALEQYRAQLKLDQARFDDALTFVRTGGDLDAAIANLDTILTDFPSMLAALHLRGVAYHYKWLQTVPIQRQKLRVSLPTYAASFIENIRGATPGDPTLLRRARQDYEQVLGYERLPYTLSNLALLDAYGGRLESALRLSGEAYDSVGSDPRVLNNLGVVFYLSGSLDRAQAAFKAASRAVGDSDNLPILFNFGKTLVTRHDPQGRAVLQRYLKLDQSSDWRREAAALLGVPVPVSPVGRKIAPPRLAGLELGNSADHVATVLGRPDATRPSGEAEVWRYEDRGIVVIVHRRYGVVGILLRRADGGGLDGVQVGDPAGKALQTWGHPDDVSEGTWIYGRGDWAIAVGVEDDRVALLGIIVP